MEVEIKKAAALEDRIEKVKADQIEVSKTLSVEVERKSQKMVRYVEDKVRTFEQTYVTNKETMKSLNHQMEMFVKDFNRLDKE